MPPENIQKFMCGACAIWYHLYNLKNVKTTHGGVLILVKLQDLLNCTNGTKLRRDERKKLASNWL